MSAHDSAREDAPGPLHPRLSLGLRIGIVALLLVAVWFRVAALGHIPGFATDEAWFPVQADKFVHGGPYPLSTISGYGILPLYNGELILLHWIHPQPAIWLVRMVAVFDGLLLLALTFWLLRRSLGRETALLATLLLAALPAAIAYSRIAWSANENYPMVMLCLGLTLCGYYGWALSALMLGVVMVHPTIIFLAPVLAGIAAGRWALDWETWPAERRRRMAGWCLGALAALGILGFMALRQLEWFTIPWEDVRLRLLHPHWAVDFVREYGRLLSGVTIYESFLVPPVSRAARWTHEILFWSAAAPLAVFGTWRLIRARRWPELGLEVGFFAGMILFYFRAAGAMHAGFERYTVPLTLTGALLGIVWLRACIHRQELARALVVLCAVALLASFDVHYFRAFRSGPAWDCPAGFEPTSETAPVEPRQAALDIVRKAAPNGPVTILTQDVWMAEPLRYLTLGDERVAVQQLDLPDCSPDQWKPGSRLFSVEFVRYPQKKIPLPRSLTVAREWIIRAYSGERLISVREMKLPATQAKPVE